MKFSSRLTWDLADSDHARVVARARRERADIADLSETNPTRVGLREVHALAELLSDARSASYDPAPLGMQEARCAVASYYASRGQIVEPRSVVLSASTSEAYAWLFKLLCDAGDEVLVPSPSYPLFGYLAALEGVRTRTYPLVPEEGFRIDVAALEAAVTPSTRAIVIVAPNNPTGTSCLEQDACAIERLAVERGLALIVDEVFGDYLTADEGSPLRRSFIGSTPCLSFVLSGLSKVCCAPGLKLGWTVVQGPEALAQEALDRLALIADTYLSVSTPAQLAAARVLERRSLIQGELGARLRRNRDALAAAVAGAPALRVLPSNGGWTSLLQVPRVISEDGWVQALALDAGVLVHPGYFYDLTDGGTLVLSLIVKEDTFARGVRSLVELVESKL